MVDFNTWMPKSKPRRLTVGELIASAASLKLPGQAAAKLSPSVAASVSVSAAPAPAPGDPGFVGPVAPPAATPATPATPATLLQQADPKKELQERTEKEKNLQWAETELLKQETPAWYEAMLTARRKRDREWRSRDRFDKMRELPAHEFSLSVAQRDGQKPMLFMRDPYSSSVQKDGTQNMKTGRLTHEAYDALSPDQKLGVDLNGLLYEARKRDLKASLRKLDSPKETAQYNADVERIFGPGNGSDIVAPNMVRLLKEVDIVAVGQDLDEYLSMERALTNKELKTFNITESAVEQGKLALKAEARPAAGNDVAAAKRLMLSSAAEEPPEGTYSNYEQIRSPENLQALDSLTAQKAGDLIRQRMQDRQATSWSSTAAVFRPHPKDDNFKLSKLPPGYGGAWRDANTPLMTPTGEINWTKDLFFENSWDVLRNADNDLKKELAVIGERMDRWGLNAAERQEWQDWMYTRAKKEGQYGDRPSYDPNTGKPLKQLRSGEEIIKLMGWKD